MRDRVPCVHMVASGRNGTPYAGVTSDVAARVSRHREGTFRGLTARHDARRLVWFEVAERMDDAIAHEKRLKRWRREWKMNLIERGSPEWADLGPAIGLLPLRT